MIIVTIQDLERVGGSNYARVCESNETTYLDAPGYEVTFINGIDFESVQLYCKGWDCPPNEAVSAGGNGAKCGVTRGPNNPRHLIRVKHEFKPYYDTPCVNYENAYRVNIPDQNGYVVGCPNGLEIFGASASISTTASTLATSTAVTTPVTSTSVTASTSSKSLMGHVTDTDSRSSSLSFSPSSSSSSQSIYERQTTSLENLVSDAPWSTNAPAGESSGEVYMSTPTSEPISPTAQEPQQSNGITNLSKTSTQLGTGAIVGIVFASVAGFTILGVLIGVAGFIFLNLSSKGSVPQEYLFSKTTRTDKA